MFCSNCGSKLPDGSNFCSVCGARLVAPEMPNNEPQVEKTASLWDDKVADFAPQVESRTPTVSFDWSNVKEESHKKVVTGVHSPWGTTGLTDKEIFDAVENAAPSEDRSRTMSFIDILKQERDAKAKAANEEAKVVTERPEEPLDYSAFEETASFYVPPLYDIEESIQKDEPRVEREVEAEKPADEVDKSALSFETAEFEKATVAGEPSKELVNDLQSELADILSAGSTERTERDDDTLVENSYISMGDSEPDVKFDYEDEKKDSKPFSVEEFFSDMEDVAEDEELEVEEPENEEPVELSNSIFEPVVEQEEESLEDEDELDISGYLGIDDIDDIVEPVEVSEPTIDNIVFEPIVEDEPAEELEEISKEPEQVNEPVEYEDEEAEIEALKKRLAELMGTPDVVDEEPVAEPIAEPIEEPVAATSEFIDELFEEPTTELEEAQDDASPSVEEPVQEVENKELEVIADEPEQIEILLDDNSPEEMQEELEMEFGSDDEDEDEEDSDAISLDDLEKDLFGESSDEDIEAEATKKIDKFYTLYKKNEEFQKLLDEEYNKLKAEDAVPHVDDFVTEKETPVEKDDEPEDVPNQTTIAESPSMMKDEPADEAPIVELVSTEVPRVENPKPIIKRAEKKAKSEKKADKAAAGNKLTVVAVIVAALLVVVLGIILILFCAPDSALAWKIDSFLETITSYFSAVDVAKSQLLL